MQHLEEMDKNESYKLNAYTGDFYKKDYVGKPDSALLVINKIIRNEPKLKYAPFIAFHTFSSLLKTDLQKAYKYGKVVLVTSTYDEPSYFSIIEPIKWYSDKLNLPAEIYELGAEAYQTEIDQITYPEIVDVPKLYYNMAEWYWRAKNKLKAIEADQNAIKALKGRKGFSAIKMAALEDRLHQYKRMYIRTAK